MSQQTTRLEQSNRLRLSQGLVTSIRILAYDASGLTRYLEEQAADNPHLSLQRIEPAPGEWLPRWRSAFAAGHAGLDPAETLAEAAPPGLTAHALAQMRRLCPKGRAQAIGLVLVQALEPSGWLGRPLEALAQEAGASLPETEAVLRLLQQAEPTGLFARSLAECLRLQAAEADLPDPVMDCVLDNLDLLGRGDLARLARMCDVPYDQIARTLRRIRGFNPKPGAQFAQGAAPPLREPDLIATEGPEGWSVSLNRSALPDVRIRGEASQGTAQGLAAARALQRLVRSRNATLLRVAREILRRQTTALTLGATALVPMTMAEIADAVGLHESTISRTVAGTSVDTPRGTFWLRRLFSGRVAAGLLTGDAGDNAGIDGAATGLSGAGVRARLARLVATEDRTRPLSDQALGVLLADQGAGIARRTIAKYRAMMHIPPAHRRRQPG